MNPYEILGVTPESTPDEIKAAWRKLVRETHPDRNPDADPQRFVLVQRAYEILTDPEKLAQFKASGRTTDEPSMYERCLGELVKLAMMVVEHCQDVTQVNVIAAMTSRCNAEMAQVRLNQNGLRETAKRFRQVASRFCCADKAVPSNPFSFQFEKMADGQEKAAEALTGRIKLLEQCLETLKDYSYNFESAQAFWERMGADAQNMPIPRSSKYQW